MEFKQFFDNVEKEGWDWAEGECKGVDGYFIKADNRMTHTKKGLQPACVHITENAIKENDWDIIKKQFPNLTYMTRIVGYFSQIHNWNIAKKGELKDRQRGNYVVNK